MVCLYKTQESLNYCGCEATFKASLPDAGDNFTPLCAEHAEVFKRTVATVKEVA